MLTIGANACTSLQAARDEGATRAYEAWREGADKGEYLSRAHGGYAARRAARGDAGSPTPKGKKAWVVETRASPRPDSPPPNPARFR